MSRAPEQRLWDRTKSYLKPFKGIRLERYENVMGVGCPDVLAICDGLVTWVELKFVEGLPARATTRVFPGALTREQMNWHLDWRQHGGRSIVLGAIGPDIVAIENTHTDLFNDMTIEQLGGHAVAATWSELAVYLGWKP